MLFFLKHPESVFFFFEPQGVCFEIHILFRNLVIKTSSASREPPRDKKKIKKNKEFSILKNQH